MKTILDIGNCNADHSFLNSMLQKNFAGTQLLRAHRLDDALSALQENEVDLILINRLLDVDGSEGMQILQHLKADSELQQTPVMLITNFDEHQQTAIQAGAVQGFGKSGLLSEETRQAIAAALGEG